MTQKKTYRMAQVNRLLREEIATLLLTELQDPRTRDIAITEVRASSDLKHAIVFVSTHQREAGADYVALLRERAGYIRKLLFPRLHLKHIPELDFRYDQSLDTAERIFRTLDEVDLGSEDEIES